MDWSIKNFNELSVNILYEIMILRNKVFIVEQYCAYQDLDGKDIKAWHLFCRDNNNSIIACCRILPKHISYKETAIGRVCILQDYRKQGLGKEMMHKAIHFITEELKENEIKISAQCYLIDFYSSFGFIPVSSEYFEDNILHIEMLYQKTNGNL